MLSRIPTDLSNVKPEDINKEVLRAAIIAELDAINLYEEMANMASNRDIRTILLDVAREEKTHVEEFKALLLRLDPEQGGACCRKGRGGRGARVDSQNPCFCSGLCIHSQENS